MDENDPILAHKVYDAEYDQGESAQLNDIPTINLVLDIDQVLIDLKLFNGVIQRVALSHFDVEESYLVEHS